MSLSWLFTRFRYVEFQYRQVELTQIIVSTEGHVIKVLNTEIIQIVAGHFT